jgi:histidine ammonia-lyase
MVKRGKYTTVRDFFFRDIRIALSLDSGGNFQAMSISNAMEKTRLALHHIGKLLFAQTTELLNPAMNRGLPPSLAASDPSLNYFGKGVDIATAAYVSELGYLANPVSTHIQVFCSCSSPSRLLHTSPPPVG